MCNDGRAAQRRSQQRTGHLVGTLIEGVEDKAIECVAGAEASIEPR